MALSNSDDLARVTSLADKQAIASVLAVHSRGVDRADANLLGSAYHPDATVDYGFFAGPASEMVAMLATAQKGQPVTLHRTSNMWIKTDRDRATSESYVVAYMEHVDGTSATQRLVGGRYLDRHQRRDGEWRLMHRTYVMDWNINRPSTASWTEPPVSLAQFVPRGGQGAADPGRTLLAFAAAGFAQKGERAVDARNLDATIDEVLSKQALHELLMAYSRGVDRADQQLLESIFDDESTVVTGVVNGSGTQFAREITQYVRTNLERCFHSVANEWFMVKGDHAVGESYVIATATAAGQETMTGGRYIDSFERRNGTWKIKSRAFVMDWSTTQASTHETGGLYAALTTRGSFGATDPVYDFWNW